MVTTVTAGNTVHVGTGHRAGGQHAADRERYRAGQRGERRGSSVTVSSNSADGGSRVANATFQRSPTGANTWTTIGVPDTVSPYAVTWNTTSGTPTACTTCGS